MKRNLALATATVGMAAFAMVAGFAAAQETETTTTTHATSSTTANPDVGMAGKKKPKEAYEWSVDTTTTKVPVHPTVVEKTTTTTNVVPPPVVSEHTSTTTTTSTGDR